MAPGQLRMFIASSGIAFALESQESIPRDNGIRIIHANYDYGIEPPIILEWKCSPCGASVKKKGQICHRCQRARMKLAQ